MGYQDAESDAQMNAFWPTHPHRLARSQQYTNEIARS
jgi:hypothetical protein